MRRPSLRDADHPLGFDVSDGQTRTGNILANRSGQLMMVGSVNDAAGLWETPFSSKMKHLPSWKAIRRQRSASEVRTDSCRFGSIHQKGFRFLAINICLDSIAKRCNCTTKHVPVQGKFTAKSATYTPQLAHGIALCFQKAIKAIHELRHSMLDTEVKGLESILVNDVAVSSKWEEVSSWTFRKDGHINILELSAVFRLASRLASSGKPLRVTNLVDSNVVKGAVNKGRTSSLGLGSLVRKHTALCVSAGLYFSIPYVPTRSNASDDPTRDRAVRENSSSIIDESWSREEIFDLASLPKVRRWAANWMRLVIAVLGPKVLYLHRRDLYRQKTIRSGALEEEFRKHRFEFDSTLGFPGEGPSGSPVVDLVPADCQSPVGFSMPSSHSSQQVDFAPPSLTCSRPRVGAGWLLVLLLANVSHGAMAMPMFPKNAGETSRARIRAARGPLPEGRPVLPSTGSARQKYLR